MVIIAINETFFKAQVKVQGHRDHHDVLMFLFSVEAGYGVLFVNGRVSVRCGMYESDGVHNPPPTAERLNPVSVLTSRAIVSHC